MLREDGTPVGSGFAAQLFVGTSTVDLRPVGSPQAFRSGATAGLWATDVITLTDTVPGAAVVAQVRVWPIDRYPTFELAQSSGAPVGVSGMLRVRTGGVGTPPSAPGKLEGMQSFRLSG